MEIRLLGPVEVRRGAELVPLGGPNARTVLALLALHAGEVVGIHRLVDALWGADPPATATDQVYGYVSRLRRKLAKVRAEPGRQLIATRPPGYVLQLERGELDLDDFEARYTTGREALARGDAQRARDVLFRALALWQGPALGDTATRLPAEAARLEERRLAALDDRIEADLVLGRHQDLVAELRKLVAEHPFRERLAGQLMRALYWSGRQADALGTFARARRAMVEELGLEPGRDLRELHQAILDNTLPAARQAPPVLPGGRAAQIPRDNPDFTGRAKEVVRLVDAVRHADAPGPAVCVIAGRAGVGKTTLAVHAAHRLHEEFPDGRLYIDLLGARSVPLDPSAVLARLLGVVGVSGSAVPETLEERAALWRSRLAGLRLLIVFDNVADERQVRPLLPGRGRSAVLVTSRSRLPALDVALRIDLEVLDDDEAAELLRRIVGPDRTASATTSGSDLATLRDLVRFCGNLPLALRVVGARLVANPHWSLSRLADRLSDERNRLDELAAADLEVRAVLASAYTGLDGPRRRMFRLLGLLEAPEFSSWVGAALLDTSVERAEDLLDDLVRAYLLDAETGPDGQVRYHLHDLLRLLARERAQEEETAAEIESAVSRALNGWLFLTEKAERRLNGGSFSVLGDLPPTWSPGAETADRLLTDAMGWLESERPALRAAVEQAVSLGAVDLACGIAASLLTYFETRSLFEDWQYTHELVLGEASRAGLPRAEAVMRYGLAEILQYQDRTVEAMTCWDRAGAGFAELGDRYGEALCTAGKGSLHRIHGQYTLAAECLEQAALVLEELGAPGAESVTRHQMGILLLEQGRWAEAQDCLERALDLARRVSFGRGAAQPLRGLGLLHFRQGRLGPARRFLEQARTAARSVGDLLAESLAVCLLAQVEIACGEYSSALAHLRSCLPVYRQAGDRFNEAFTLCAMGDAYRLSGELDDAGEALEQAMTIWNGLTMPLWRARTLVTVGDLHADKGEPAEARRIWEHCLEAFEELNAPDVEAVRSRLDR